MQHSASGPAAAAIHCKVAMSDRGDAPKPPALVPRAGRVRGRGRPTKLTKELQDQLVNLISIGSFYKSACSAVGISYSTFREWLRRGEQASRGKYRAFYEAITRADGTAETSLVAFWYSGATKSWVAARALLERRYPERWGPPQHPMGAPGPAGAMGLTSVELDDASAAAMSEAARQAAEEERGAARLIMNQTYFGAASPPLLTGTITSHTHKPPTSE